MRNVGVLDVWKRAYALKNTDATGKTAEQAINLTEVTPVLCILAAGTFLSIFVLAAEFCINRFAVRVQASKPKRYVCSIP
jgi:hypothetical protein